MTRMSTVVILSALPREIALIQETYPGDVLHEGGLDIMHHQDGDVHIFSTFGGMGTTNIAAAAQTLLTVARYEVGAPADALIFTGIAGNLNARLGFGDIALAETLVYEDTDTGIIAEDPPYRETFGSTPELLALAERVARDAGMTFVENNASVLGASGLMYTPSGIREVPSDIDDHTQNLAAHRYTVGTVATSNLFSTEPSVLTRIIDEDHADAEEMEGAAVSHVCYKNDIPHVIIRSMSNDCGESYEALDGRENDLNTSARLAAQVALGVVAELVK
ncbi:phosphorylase family protein [Alloscardovia macacae]|uniref:Phosphorylase family protein n=2 Tax=Alloscardovia macacae TaxID=1160091 RepID=A0A261F3L6_9BIFI|nr:phosphorylase family protein [Alloscardovia macacae]